MYAPEQSDPLSGNRFLSQLSEEAFGLLEPDVEVVELRLEQVVHEKDALLKHIYFPTSSVLSVCIQMDNNESIEISTVGSDGFAGAELLIGARVALSTRVCKVPGECIRLPVDVFRGALENSTELQHVAGKYLSSYMNALVRSQAEHNSSAS
jgi:CRP-like cAMP-binding protein